MIYSHSHGDHWGGVRGIADEADVNAGKVEIIATRDFMEFAIAENVFETGFEMLPGTKTSTQDADLNDFEVGVAQLPHG
ncbi:MAG: hypothetical protein BMS9Abin01_0686 [Gammaproteobacteria bacterium]|nr:MAG: hypothetical protein BMS9Abin01_0686 [Gammaproteobacteria bacterium]